jgi:hypothetical protein|tara:strand:+ start:40 stop:861 length:822 start_codon:yes stop_codon:yes gene_type:complete
MELQMDLTILNKNKTDLIVNNKSSELQARVSAGLPAIYNQTRVFDRNNSQTTLTLSTLTMLNGQSPMRMMRQVMAEIEKRQSALYEAQHNVAKMKSKLEKLLNRKDDLNNVEQAKAIKLQHNLTMTENKANGSLKDIAILMDAYDSIKENNDIDNWSEFEFEQEEKAHHVRRGFELLYRNLVEYGRGKEATLEYLQQYGVHVQIAIAEVTGYIKLVDSLVNRGTKITSLHLEDFLDEMKDKYANNADEVSQRLFGTSDITNKEYMTLIKASKK